MLTLSTELTTAQTRNTQHLLSGDETLEPTGEYSVPEDERGLGVHEPSDRQLPEPALSVLGPGGSELIHGLCGCPVLRPE